MHSREIKSLIYQKAEKAVRGTMVRSVTHQILTYWWFFTFFVAVFSQILRWMSPRSTWTLATTTSTDLPCHLGFGRQEIRIAASIHIFCLVYFIGGPVFRQRPLKNHPFWGRITSLMCASVMHQQVNLVFFVSRFLFVPCDNIYAIGSDGDNTAASCTWCTLLWWWHIDKEDTVINQPRNGQHQYCHINYKDKDKTLCTPHSQFIIWSYPPP